MGWGDGTPVEHFSALDALTHTYVDDDPTATPHDDYTVSVIAYWSDAQTASDSGTVTVNNVAPLVTLDSFPATVNENEAFTIEGTITDPGLLDTIESATLYIDLNFDGDTSDEDEEQEIELSAAGPGQWTFNHTTGVVVDDGATFDVGDDDEDGDVTERIWGNETAQDSLAFTIVALDDDSETPGSAGGSLDVLNVAPEMSDDPSLRGG